MDIPAFITVIKNFSDTSVKEAESLMALKENYPFSQVLHALAARVSKDHGLNDSQKELQLAAVYAADRSALKLIIESIDSSPVVIKKPTPTISGAESNIDYATEVINDLERLNQLRHNFELLFTDTSSTSFQLVPEHLANVEEPETDDRAEKFESSKSKKERIIELAKSVSAENTMSPNEQGKTNRRKRKDTVEALMDHIVVSKVELSPESDKQKEQIELIDHFIKVQPTILGAKDKQVVPEDLTSIKTGDFNDSIISETLVEILLKQGKKEKAVEVLKKLIWKFPQKKAYFATQIEELKK